MTDTARLAALTTALGRNVECTSNGVWYDVAGVLDALRVEGFDLLATLDAARAPGLDEALLARALLRVAYPWHDLATDDPPVMDVGDLSDSGNETAHGLAAAIAREYAALAERKSG